MRSGSQNLSLFQPDYKLPFIHIGTEKQLFLDNYILGYLDNVEREVIRPQKTEKPLIEYEELPWEQYGIMGQVDGAIKDPDDGLFKMWYQQSLNGNFSNREDVLCYAESEDGIHWKK